jgi:virulence-associated protein VapD
MFAIAFDLVVVDTEAHHPNGVTQAYADIRALLKQYGFRNIQGSLYVTDNENLATCCWR